MKYLSNNLKRTLLTHLIFWIISIILFTVMIFYNRNFDFSIVTVTMVVSIISTIALLAVSVYINLLWIIPKFFNKKKFFLFSILQILNIALFILLNFFLTGIVEKGLHPNLYQEAVAELILVIIFLSVSTLIKFMEDSIELHEVELKIKEVERQKIESELRALKAQINPHFFFNTLNSMYALSLDNSEKTPELILKLSELMRYILYESADDMVPMERQIDFVKNYIYLEKLRTDEKLKVNFDIKGQNTAMSVAPLLLIPFVENAFKHVGKKNISDAYIDIMVDITRPDRLIFRTENNKDTERTFDTRKAEGIGLANVRKRLELLYPLKHNLDLKDQGDKFVVELNIETL